MNQFQAFRQNLRRKLITEHPYIWELRPLKSLFILFFFAFAGFLLGPLLPFSNESILGLSILYMVLAGGIGTLVIHNGLADSSIYFPTDSALKRACLYRTILTGLYLNSGHFLFLAHTATLSSYRARELLTIENPFLFGASLLLLPFIYQIWIQYEKIKLQPASAPELAPTFQETATPTTLNTPLAEKIHSLDEQILQANRSFDHFLEQAPARLGKIFPIFSILHRTLDQLSPAWYSPQGMPLIWAIGLLPLFLLFLFTCLLLLGFSQQIYPPLFYTSLLILNIGLVSILFYRKTPFWRYGSRFSNFLLHYGVLLFTFSFLSLLLLGSIYQFVALFSPAPATIAFFHWPPLLLLTGFISSWISTTCIFYLFPQQSYPRRFELAFLGLLFLMLLGGALVVLSHLGETPPQSSLLSLSLTLGVYVLLNLFFVLQCFRFHQQPRSGRGISYTKAVSMTTDDLKSFGFAAYRATQIEKYLTPIDLTQRPVIAAVMPVITFSDECGVQLWEKLDDRYNSESLIPFFESTHSQVVDIPSAKARSAKGFLDAWVEGAQDRPFLHFYCVNYGVLFSLPDAFRAQFQLLAFPIRWNRIKVFTQVADYHAYPKKQILLSVGELIPTGRLIDSKDQLKQNALLLSGKIQSLSRQKNQQGNASFWHILLQTQCGLLNVVLPNRAGFKKLTEGDILYGEFQLLGRFLLLSPADQEKLSHLWRTRGVERIAHQL